VVGGIYRLRVLVGARLLGYADLQVVGTREDLKSVPEGFIGLVRDDPFPVRFRIEHGLLGAITVTPAEAELEPGERLQLVAQFRDLHGQPLTPEVPPSMSQQSRTRRRPGISSPRWRSSP
jgi:hypothetical protein